MNLCSGRAWCLLFVVCLAVSLSACGGSATPQAEPVTSGPTAPAVESPATATPQAPAAPASTPTPTSTPTPAAAPLPSALPPTAVSRCEGLVGQLEIQILVGPAEAVGLEPVAVGNVPFVVITSAPPYLVEGQGPISYEATLTEEWGTYAVTMDMETAVQGECSGGPGSEQLNLVLQMAGEQLVVVDAEGFHGEYPWAGTQSRDLAFPLEEGATSQGEGWAVVLHLGSR
jgi:hypothetical protein